MKSDPVIDAHHHLWRIDRGDYSWMSPDMGEPLYRDYLPGDLAPLLRRAGVDKTVVVQAADSDAETEFLLDLADVTEFVAGVVGWLDMEDTAFEKKLDALVGRPKFVGLRPMLQDLADDAYIVRPKVLASLAALAERGVAFDFLIFPRHLRHVADALSAVPSLRGVIDHLSKPPIATGPMDGWADDLKRVAAFPSVSCKVSGMITEAKHDAWRPSDLGPYVDHVLASFGPDRMIFGSDWPVCLLAGSYSEALNALRSQLDKHLTPNQCAAVYGGNAARFYRLKLQERD